MCSSCPEAEHRQQQQRPPTQALLFTQNTTRNPISWNPALRQPNPNEVLHSVHLALHRALDPCVNGSGDACSWSVVDVPDLSVPPTKGAPLPVSARVLVIPRPSELKPVPVASLDHPEISVKLRFYGPHDGVDRCTQVDEALKHLEHASGFKEIDRFMIGFDGIRWAGGDEECDSGCDEVDLLVKAGIWKHISSNASLKTVGVSDFSSNHLKRLLSQLPDNASTRRPKIDQLNFDKDLPDTLISLAKDEGIELQSHADNRVPYEGIEVLLKEFQERLPLPPSFAELRAKGAPAIEMHWVMKYTIVLKDRGLVADKGFILSFGFN